MSTNTIESQTMRSSEESVLKAPLAPPDEDVVDDDEDDDDLRESVPTWGVPTISRARMILMLIAFLILVLLCAALIVAFRANSRHRGTASMGSLPPCNNSLEIDKHNVDAIMKKIQSIYEEMVTTSTSTPSASSSTTTTTSTTPMTTEMRTTSSTATSIESTTESTSKLPILTSDLLPKLLQYFPTLTESRLYELLLEQSKLPSGRSSIQSYLEQTRLRELESVVEQSRKEVSLVDAMFLEPVDYKEAEEKYGNESILQHDLIDSNELSQLFLNGVQSLLDQDNVVAEDGDDIIDALNDNNRFSGGDTDFSNDDSQVSLRRLLSARSSLSPTLSSPCGAIGLLECSDHSGCYSLAEKCNRNITCTDGSDEFDCECVDFMKSAGLSCDDIVDCNDGLDEDQCNDVCAPSQFQCEEPEEGNEDEVMCLDKMMVCDSVYNCHDGSDEHDCLSVAPLEHPLNPSAAGSPHSKGLLYWRLHGQQFFIVGIDSKNNETNVNSARDLFTRMADEACSLLLPQRDVFVDPKVSVATLSSLTADYATIPVAHLIFSSSSSSDPFFGPLHDSRFTFAVTPATTDTLVANIDCGEPLCGMGGSNVATEKEKNADEVNFNHVVKPKIVGGSSSSALSWPFVVQLYRAGEFACGASIVDEWFILTAAHCLFGFNNANNGNPKYEVIVGALRRQSRAPWQYTRTLREIFIHPDFEPNFLMHDIALAKLDKPLWFNAHVSPICLPPSSSSSIPKVDDLCLALGWGTLGETEKSANTLQQALVPILDGCVRSYNDDEFQICAGFKDGGVDSCHGDSGGPLLCEHPTDASRSVLGGAISHGEGCARPGLPGVYVRIQRYMEWILAKLTDESSSDPSVKASSICNTKSCDDDRCIFVDHLCNGFIDCHDKSDETSCQRYATTNTIDVGDGKEAKTNTTTITDAMREELSFHPLPSLQPKITCTSDEFSCKWLPECVPLHAQCNGSIECKDESDEHNCGCHDMMLNNHADLVCDGIYDCHDDSDEVDCPVCGANMGNNQGLDSMYYCHQSNLCINSTQMCNVNDDCTHGEDERYCITLITTNQLLIDSNNHPIDHNRGMLAFNDNGDWSLVCRHTWNQELSNKVCRYLGRGGESRYELVDSNKFPGVRGQTLPILKVSDEDVVGSPRDFTGRHRRQANNDESDEGDVVSEEDKACSFIMLECSSQPSCGTMPLYRKKGNRFPIEGEGVFPWTVHLYSNGAYLCGATLVHPHWLITATECADQTSISQGDYVVARGGGYRSLFTLSSNEQVRRVLSFINMPGTMTSMAHLTEPFDMTDHVAPVCIPSSAWLPIGTKCYITGSHDGLFNFAVERTLDGLCDLRDSNSFLCTADDTDQNRNSNDNLCLNKWAGTLVCPDAVGTYYAIGTYHTNINEANCRLPTRFEPLITSSARDAIMSIMASADGPNDEESEEEDSEEKSPLLQHNLMDSCETHRCVLGQCLHSRQVCNGIQDCDDYGDETHCKGDEKGLKNMCAPFNSTHCTCKIDQMMCNNGMCVSKSFFCDDHDDCGDESDEPPNCHSDCLVNMEVMEPHKLCDNNEDCPDGRDESSAVCCTNPQDFKCVVNSQIHSGQCIDRSRMNDFDPQCDNQADESDYIVIFNDHHRSNSIPRDKYGRLLSSPQGHLYFVVHGQAFLYCVDSKAFKAEMDTYANKICLHEGFSGLHSVALHAPPNRSLVEDVVLDNEELETFKECNVIFIQCHSAVEESILSTAS